MEATPYNFDIDKFKLELYSVKNILAIHDLHVWYLSIGKPSMSVHLRTNAKDIN